MEWPGRERCPAVSRIANNSKTVRRIEILRSRYVLQLLILSTGTHFQRVSEHYMVTRTFLSIFTLERERSGTKSTQYISMAGVRTYSRLYLCIWRRVYIVRITTHGPGIVDPPPGPPTTPKMAKKQTPPLFLLRPNYHPHKREKQFSQRTTYPPRTERYTFECGARPAGSATVGSS